MSLYSPFPICLKFHPMELQTVMLKANIDLTGLDMNSYYYYYFFACQSSPIKREASTWSKINTNMTEKKSIWHCSTLTYYFCMNHRLDGHEFKWTPGVGDGQGGLACCNSWGHKESDTTEWLNWTELNVYVSMLFSQSSHPLLPWLCPKVCSLCLHLQVRELWCFLSLDHLEALVGLFIGLILVLWLRE